MQTRLWPKRTLKNSQQSKKKRLKCSKYLVYPLFLPKVYYVAIVYEEGDLSYRVLFNFILFKDKIKIINFNKDFANSLLNEKYFKNLFPGCFGLP